MKNVGYLLLIGCIALSCASSQKLLQKGRYDQAIQKSSQKLRKDPNNQEELSVLKEAYYQANRIDEERISFLKKEDQDENWVEIYQLYSRMDARQDMIERLPSQVRNEFTFVNYDDQIIRSKEVAASVSYNQGLEYLKRGDRLSARQAYQEFERAKSIYHDYRDVNQKLEEARLLGTNNALFKIENNSDVVLPKDFDTEMRKIALKELNTPWLNFDTYQDTTRFYDYYIVLNIKQIKVSPEVIDRRTFTESKEVQDGMKYVLDARGNVAKDSLGNDIKEPNMVTISAEVTESVQRKSALLAGSIDYIDLRTEQLVKTENISVEAEFAHYSATVAGNTEALSEETAQKVGQRPVPFPPNEAMLMDTVTLLKEKAKAIIAYNRQLLEN
jgi:hypothetical protein